MQQRQQRWYVERDAGGFVNGAVGRRDRTEKGRD